MADLHRWSIVANRLLLIMQFMTVNAFEQVNTSEFFVRGKKTLGSQRSFVLLLKITRLLAA
jgi:hypothetical protein